MTSLQQPTQKQENTTNDQIVLNILRCQVEKTLNSLIKDKFHRNLQSNELNEYCTSGVRQLLKIYSSDEKFQTKTTHNENTDIITTSSNETEEKKKELSAILNILSLSSEQILDHIHQQFQSQLNKQLEKQEILNILTTLPTQEIDESEENDDEKNDEDEADEQDHEDLEETNDNDNEDDDEEEEYVGMTEEEFSQEIAEAFENVRRLGRVDGQRIARFVRDSFCEINGREPELREIADVFTRIKDKLAQEAKEDGDLLSSSRNIIIKDDITDAKDSLEESPLTNNDDKNYKETLKKLSLMSIDVNNANEEEKEELLKFARNLVKEDLQIQAKSQLSKLIGREPTKLELNDMLIQLATTSLLDCNFDSGDDASDYNPDTNEEKQQLLNDNEETAAFDEENSREKEEPTLKDKPVLTTPVKNKGASSRVDYYFEKYNDDCSELLINKAVNSFKKMHNRVPNNDELDNMKHFLHTEKADLLSEQIAEANEQDKENSSFKLNFGAEDTVEVD